MAIHSADCIIKAIESDGRTREAAAAVLEALRAPMTSILGFAELLVTRELEEDERRQYAQVILEEAARLTRLLDHLDSKGLWYNRALTSAGRT